MPVRRETGGLKTFVDNGTHNSPLTPEDAAKIDASYEKVRQRRRQNNIILLAIIVIAIIAVVAKITGVI